jgi:pimeloyl-ACP methyl ester carboxylesterase
VRAVRLLAWPVDDAAVPSRLHARWFADDWLALRMNTVRIRSSDGVSIGCERVGNGAPIVLVHGSTTARQRWQPVVPALAARSQLWLMDRRGRGISGDAPDHSLQLEISDVAAVAHAAAALSLVAHSYGAVCALQAALACPRLERLVLYEAPIPVGLAAPTDEAHIREIEDRIANGMPEDALLTFHRSILRMREPEIAALRRSPAWEARVAIVHTLPRELRAVRQYRFDPAQFADLHIPVLVLLGGESPERYAKSAAVLMQGLPNARLVTLAGQQHNAITTAPELFAREVLNFLALGGAQSSTGATSA